MSEKLNFSLNNTCDCSLNVKGQVLVASHSVCSPILGNSSQGIVFTGENNLLELSVREAAILIVVKELDEAIEFPLRNIVDTILSEEIEELTAINGLIGISVNPLEGHAGLEVAYLCESLPQALNLELPLSYGSQVILEPTFGFVA
jgi:hypothetical protein